MIISPDQRRGAVAGVETAFVELLNVLVERNVIELTDWDRIRQTLTDLSAAYEMKPDQRAAIEDMATILHRLRPEK